MSKQPVTQTHLLLLQGWAIFWTPRTNSSSLTHYNAHLAIRMAWRTGQRRRRGRGTLFRWYLLGKTWSFANCATVNESSLSPCGSGTSFLFSWLVLRRQTSSQLKSQQICAVREMFCITSGIWIWPSPPHFSFFAPRNSHPLVSNLFA